MADEQSLAAGGLSPVRLNGAVRRVTAALLALCLASPLLASTHKTSPAPPSKSETAQQQFAHAATMRQDLEGRPHGDRTKLEYGRVMDAYRAVYHGNPSSGKSADAITAVAELLAEEGRLFAERKPLEDAVGQYEFLRKQYPTSPLRLKGTLVEAEILDHDLGDQATARALLQEFLKNYPHSDLAPQARQELASAGESNALKMPQSNLPGTKLGGSGLATSKATPAISAKSVTNRPGAIGDRDAAPIEDSASPRNLTPTPLPEPAPASQARATYADGPQSRGREPAPAVLTQVSERQTPPARSGGRVMITDIRHWSTPNYTRVAIDLGGEVRFQAGRIPNPDRIYFDLYNTRLAPQLMGHLISVQSDAFLKDIRSATIHAGNHAHRARRQFAVRIFGVPAAQSVSADHRCAWPQVGHGWQSRRANGRSRCRYRHRPARHCGCGHRCASGQVFESDARWSHETRAPAGDSPRPCRQT